MEGLDWMEGLDLQYFEVSSGSRLLHTFAQCLKNERVSHGQHTGRGPSTGLEETAEVARIQIEQRTKTN
jgi:hypothetical protein